MRRLRVVLFTVLALAFAAVEVARVAELARPTRRLSAHGERRWFRFAHWRDDVPARFDELAAGLRPGEEITLVVPQVSPLDFWWWAMASYHLPRQRVVAVVRGRAPHPVVGSVLVRFPPRRVTPPAP